MATVKHSDSIGMYSWWWNSHISPKNSKWLQENLTDMDTKVKQMIKLIEEDADSFARRAEMYYKKRPELMKLVEEFYRAYRAMAERYDHATGVLRQAHRTMAEAFPNQVPLVFADESPGGLATEVDPRSPVTPPPLRPLSEPDELQKDAVGLSSYDLFGSNEAINHVKFGEVRARKSLNFDDTEEKDQSLQNNGDTDLGYQVLSESERVSKAEVEISNLKNALAKFEAEKEAGLLEYRRSLERLSNLEKEVSRAQEDSQGLNERASQAEAEVLTLMDSLAKLEAERAANLDRYQQCLEKINNLENSITNALNDAGELNERARQAETEVRALKQELAELEAEKKEALTQYKQCTQTISNLEQTLSDAEERAGKLTERAEKAETELETLRLVVLELTKDKEAAAIQYQQCLETISSLENKLARAEEEAQRLHGEIDDGAAKLKGAEERCSVLERTNRSLHLEFESLVRKMGDQSQELTEKQKELGRLWTSIHEERLRFTEAETAFHALQHLHSQSQEELRLLAAELQNTARNLQDFETLNQGLEAELQRIKDENNDLNELNISSAMSVENLQEEILSLRVTIAKLEAEVELRVDHRNALQQEIYCLKEEVNDFNKRHRDTTGQLESVGLNLENFASSVMELKDKNRKLKDVRERDTDEKLALQDKLKIMEKLIEKNSLLENSLSDMNDELECVRGRVKILEEYCHSLLGEKSTLAAEKDTVISQLQIAAENLEKLSEKNNFLENSLFNANAKLEGFRVKLTNLESSCLLLGDEKSGLIKQTEGLMSQLDVGRKKFEELEKRYQGLEEKYSSLEKERKATFCEVEELQKLLEAEKTEHTSFVQLSETQVTAMESQIHILQVENLCRTKKYEEELDKAMSAQLENFILQKCAQDLEEKQMEMKPLFDQITILRTGLYQILSTLQIDATSKQDQSVMDDNMPFLIENSILSALLGQLKLGAENLLNEKNSLHQELSIRSDAFTGLQKRAEKLVDMNEELKSKVIEGGQREEVLQTETGSVRQQLLVLQREHQSSLEDNRNAVDERKSLMKEVLDLCKEKHNLEDENYAVFAEAMSESNTFLVLKDIIADNFEEIKHLTDNLDKLKCLNNDLEGKLRIMERKFDDMQLENSHLKDSMRNLENELVSVKLVGDQLKDEVSKGKDLLGQKEIVLLETERMLNESQEERAQMHEFIEDLTTKYEEVMLICEDQKRQIRKLSRDYDHQSKETESIRRANQKLEVELANLNGELEKRKLREDSLSVELRKRRNEVELWESKAAALSGELQIHTVHAALLEDSIRNSENELVSVKLVGDQLNDEVSKGKDLLDQKEVVLLETERILSESQEERAQMHEFIEDLTTKYEEVMLIGEDQKKQIRKLSRDYDHQSKETESFRRANLKLEVELANLHGELEERKLREDSLSVELQKRRNEVELWESKAAALSGELQIYTVHAVLLEETAHEFSKECEVLESIRHSKAMEVEELKRSAGILKRENGELKAHLAAYVPAVVSLMDSVTSLGSRTRLSPKYPADHNDEATDADLATELHAENCQQPGEGQIASVPDGFPDVQGIHRRIKSIEKAVVEMQKLASMENLNLNSKLETAMRQIEELRFGSSSRRERARAKRQVNARQDGGKLGHGLGNNVKAQRPTPEISEESEMMMKDILLDQTSECSSYGLSRRETAELDNQMLELWETTDRDGNIALKVSKSQKIVSASTGNQWIGTSKARRGKNLSAESLVKELGVDKESSKRFTEPYQEGSKRKILDRLDSDAQKLANLQITVQDLKKKVEITEKGKKGEGIEYDTVKQQLEEAEEAIIQLFDVNRKLVTHVEDCSRSLDGKPALESDESGSFRRRRVAEQARRGSEKIARLQLEVQKIQFLLLKLDAKESKGPTRIMERKTRVLLRDYLYGGIRKSQNQNQKKKKAPFCACANPPTKGD